MRTAVVAILSVGPLVARADQCELMPREQAEKAAAALKIGAQIYEWCAPCGEKSPSASDTVRSVSARKIDDEYWAIIVNETKRDAAYLYVQSSERRADNLARLAGCSTEGVADSLDLAALEGPSNNSPSAPEGDPLYASREALQALDRSLNMGNRALRGALGDVPGALEQSAKSAAAPDRAKELRALKSRYQKAIVGLKPVHAKATAMFQPCAQVFYRAEAASSAPPTSEAGKTAAALVRETTKCSKQAKAHVDALTPLLTELEEVISEAQVKMMNVE